MRKLATTIIASCCLLAMASMAFATNAPQTIPFSQNWTNIGLITANDDWSGVPGIIGYLGDSDPAGAVTNVDPRTLTADIAVAVDVIANQLNPNTNISGGVGEFEITDPVVALQGSGTADAPYIVLHLDTQCRTNITLSYDLRDIDGAADNSAQQHNAQYRIGSTGSWTNLTGTYVADATTGPSLAVLVTPISVVLPVAAEGQPLVQVRMMTTNAGGSDEWVGIDNISVTGTNTCGACCLRNTTTGACQILSGSACQAVGGIYLGDGTQCSQATCATPTNSKTWGSVKTLYR